MKQITVASRGRSEGDWHDSEHQQRLEPISPDTTNSITSVSKDNMILTIYDTH